jgi:membrane AbrB-like protein
MQLLILLAAGAAAGLGAKSLNFPGGAAVGAMLGVGLANVVLGGSTTRAPQWLELSIQILVGLLIGVTITRDLLGGILGLIGPIVLVVGALSLVALLLSLVLQRWFGLDIVTALFATAPGGIASMAVLGQEAGGKPFIVALVHVARVVGVFLVVPVLARLLGRTGVSTQK